MQYVADPNSIVISKTDFDNLLRAFDRTIHSGIKDEQSFLRKILNLNKVNSIFSIYENHKNDRFSIQITSNGSKRTNLQIMITDYLSLGYPLQSLIEQTSLFFLLEEIPKLTPPFSYRLISDPRNKIDADINEVMGIIKTIFLEKMENYMKTYNLYSLLNCNALMIYEILLNKNTVGVNTAVVLDNYINNKEKVADATSQPIQLFTSPLMTEEPKIDDINSQEDISKDSDYIETSDEKILQEHEIEGLLTGIEREAIPMYGGGVKHTIFTGQPYFFKLISSKPRCKIHYLKKNRIVNEPIKIKNKRVTMKKNSKKGKKLKKTHRKKTQNKKRKSHKRK
jgi:hypothetical protein